MLDVMRENEEAKAATWNLETCYDLIGLKQRPSKDCEIKKLNKWEDNFRPASLVSYELGMLSCRNWNCGELAWCDGVSSHHKIFLKTDIGVI